MTATPRPLTAAMLRRRAAPGRGCVVCGLTTGSPSPGTFKRLTHGIIANLDVPAPLGIWQIDSGLSRCRDREACHRRRDLLLA